MTSPATLENHRRLIAFCHIEKAAGTSLIHVLRRIFFLRYAAARPMTDRNTENFTAHDLRTLLRINPFVVCFGGHAVIPHDNLLGVPYDIRFVTQLRSPIERAVSQFKFWNNRMSLATSWRDFLKHPVSRNFQVRKIAGSEDIGRAKELILKHFLLAGTVDQFDAFLVLFANKLRLPMGSFTYKSKNIDRAGQRLEIPEAFFDGLRERNQLDQALYDWVATTLFTQYTRDYRGDFESDLIAFRKLQGTYSPSAPKSIMDFIYRNAYLKPVSGAIRTMHGMPYSGSYAER